MKKLIIATTSLLFIGSAVSITSCTKLVSCSTATINIANASIAFDDNPTTENCQKLKDALNSFLNNKNCTGADAVSTQEFQNELDSLSC